MDKPTMYRDNSGWRHIDYLARNDKFYMRVGGDGDKTDVKTLDSTNYQQWAPKMKAYLMSKEL
jgi:regulation of enolase protein 1 (concanavalin A-like superfamily)